MGEQADLLDPPLVAVDLAADRVTDLVGGDDRALPLVHRPAPRRADSHLQPAGVEVLGADDVAEAAGGHDRGLVEEIGQLGAREAIRLAGHLAEVDRHCDRLVAGVDLEDRLATLHIRQSDVDLAVEAAWPEDGGVEDVEPVRRGDDDDVVRRPEPVELDEELVERLLALLVAVRAAASLAERVELVEEYDSAAELAGLGEEVADPAGTDADVLLDELGAGRVMERHAGLAGDRAGKHRLAGAGRAVQHDPARDPRAEQVEALGRAEEIDRLCQLELGLVAAGDVVEGRDHPDGGVLRGVARRSGVRVGRHDRREAAG